MGRRYLITGGAGFIGSNFIRHLFRVEPHATVVNLDALAHAGVRTTVIELDADRGHSFIEGDIGNALLVDGLMDGIDVVVHFAAKSNVDRSISGPTVSIATNVVGTGVLIEAARRHSVPRFIHVSTDEVYGSVGEGFAEEDSALNPSSPYAASKAAADLPVRSYGTTFGYMAIITRSTNNFGPYQFPEKVIPLFVTNLVRNQRVPVYGDGHNERDWLYVEDHCRAIHLLVDEGVAGDIYNIGANNQMSNLDLTCRILAELARDESMIEHVADRPGHDDRYAVNSTKIRRLGWAPEQSFDEYLSQTVTWYQQHRSWWGPLRGEVGVD